MADETTHVGGDIGAGSATGQGASVRAGNIAGRDIIQLIDKARANAEYDTGDAKFQVILNGQAIQTEVLGHMAADIEGLKDAMVRVNNEMFFGKNDHAPLTTRVAHLEHTDARHEGWFRDMRWKTWLILLVVLVILFIVGLHMGISAVMV